MNVNEDWLVSLSVAETDGQTRAEARLAMPGCASLAGYGQAPSGVVPEFADIKTEDARALAREFLGSGGPGCWLPLDMTAALLHCHEIPLAELVPAHGEDDAAAFAAGGGVPVVLKADVPGLVHKTDADGVELDLRNEAEVAALFRIDVEVAELAAAHVADRVRCVDLVPPGERRNRGAHASVLVASGWRRITGGDAGSPLAITWVLPYRVGAKKVADRPQAQFRLVDGHQANAVGLRAVDGDVSAAPTGLTARARPEARPDRRRGDPPAMCDEGSERRADRTDGRPASGDGL